MKITIRAIVLFIATLVYLSNSVTTFSQNSWSRIIGGNGSDIAYSVQTTADKGYVLTGFTSSFGAQFVDILLVKIDSVGNIQFLKLFGGPNGEYGRSVVQTLDDGFIIGGRVWLTASKSAALYLKTNSLGDTIWTKTIESPESDRITSVQQTNDEGYILAGESSSATTGTIFGPWLIKTNSNGDIEWKKNYFNYGRSVYSVLQTSDSGFVIGGSDGVDFWMLKTNANGEVLWSKSYGDHSYSGAECVSQTEDDGFILCGRINGISTDSWVVKTDSIGDIMWTRKIGGEGYDWPLSIKQTSDLGYICAGTTESYGALRRDAWLYKLNSRGNLEWVKIFNNQGDDWAHSVSQSTDGGFIFVGETRGVLNDTDCWVVKTDSLGNLDPQTSILSNINLVSQFSLIQNYPNPFNPTTVIEFVIPKSSNVILKVFDLAGSEVAILVDEYKTPGTYKVNFNSSGLGSGIYIYQFKSNDVVLSKKMILLK